MDLYYWATPNGHKITIALEELGCPYRVVPVNIGRGEQFAPDYLRISPNNKIPALVDPEPAPGEAPIALFESGAILQYLAEKHGRLLPATRAQPAPSRLKAAERPLGGQERSDVGRTSQRFEVLKWLYWQVGGLGPMAGQNHHFTQYAPEPIPYAIERYVKETARLYGVLDRQLAGREFIAGDAYSIADIACYPWIAEHAKQRQRLADFPDLARWFAAIGARPAVQRAYAVARTLLGREHAVFTDDERRVLFGR
jgi:GST-like protein